MARESFSFPEGMMAEIIEVLRIGLIFRDPISEDVAELIDDWCDDNEEYAKEWDRRK